MLGEDFTTGDDPVVDDLVRSNRLLVAAAAHVRRDTQWACRLVAVERMRLRVAVELRAIVSGAAKRRLIGRL
jgi:hypothetical protein